MTCLTLCRYGGVTEPSRRGVQDQERATPDLMALVLDGDAVAGLTKSSSSFTANERKVDLVTKNVKLLVGGVIACILLVSVL